MQVESHKDHAFRHRSKRNWRARSCLVAFLALMLCGKAFAEDQDLHVYGDPATRSAIDAQLKKIYELAIGPGVQVELLTRDNPLQLRDALATELTGSMTGDSVNRIVGAVWTKQGKYSVEFYRSGNRLLMAYETFSFFYGVCAVRYVAQLHGSCRLGKSHLLWRPGRSGVCRNTRS